MSLDTIVPEIRKLGQIQKVEYLNTLRAIVGERSKKNKAGIALVSDFDLIVAEPNEHAQALAKVIM